MQLHSLHLSNDAEPLRTRCVLAYKKWGSVSMDQASPKVISIDSSVQWTPYQLEDSNDWTKRIGCHSNRLDLNYNMHEGWRKWNIKVVIFLTMLYLQMPPHPPSLTSPQSKIKNLKKNPNTTTTLTTRLAIESSMTTQKHGMRKGTRRNQKQKTRALHGYVAFTLPK